MLVGLAAYRKALSVSQQEPERRYLERRLQELESNTGARVSFGKGKPTVTDGPFIETKEVLGGYWMVEANSEEELVKWAQRCPADEGDVIEIRQIFDKADLAIKK
jgi:hypothetical protein